MPRHFPPPWRAEKIPGGYVVRDTNGQALAYVERCRLQSGALRPTSAPSLDARLPELTNQPDAVLPAE
jgi:hypothetical protein